MLRPLSRTFSVSVHASGGKRTWHSSSRKHGIAASSSSSQRPSSTTSSSPSPLSSSSSASKQQPSVPQTLRFGADLSRPGMILDLIFLSMRRKFFFPLSRERKRRGMFVGFLAPLEKGKKGDMDFFQLTCCPQLN